MQNTYVSVATDYDTDKVMVWERPVDGGPRSLRMVDPPRYFYVPDETGPFTSITRQKLSKLVFQSRDEFDEGKRRNPYRFESDIQPASKVLMDEYYDRKTPIITFAFLDIEVDYSSKIGFSSPDNPYAPINAITIYQSWTQEYHTIVVPPKGWTGTRETFLAQIEEICDSVDMKVRPKNIEIANNEDELLAGMLALIEEADIISGWNSEFFDLPYIIQRLDRKWGTRGTSKMCFPGAKAPQSRIVQRFGTPSTVFTIYGRTHLDYLQLFQKFTFEGRTSYSLGNILAEEVEMGKLDYEGTLEQLYNRDFARFTVYNFRDVSGLVDLDVKFKFIQLVNQMAHENTVPYEAILGTVRYVETGIMNRAHYVHKLICPDKNVGKAKNAKVEGAIVMTPRAGLWKWLGSVDITSLYPSVIRALNMSIETFVGQFVDEEYAWHGIFTKSQERFIFVESNGTRHEKTGVEWREFLFANSFAISAFGTVFDQSIPGMVADTLTFWFNERKRLNAEKKKYGKLAEEEKDPVKKAEYERLEEHYDLLQLTKKIQLNSTYGALLNEAFRFGRREIGASVTGTGRQITKFMGETIGKLVTGQDCTFHKRYARYTRKAGNGYSFAPSEEYALMLKRRDYDGLMNLPLIPVYTPSDEDPDVMEPSPAIWFTDNEGIIYGDTDSCYFRTFANNYDEAVLVADTVAEQTNSAFPEFMSRAFNCNGGRETYIKAAREIVGEAGLFLMAKKKYTIKVVNLDGKDLRAKPKLKSMGSEIKKADTPKVIQDFLKRLMNLVLDGVDYPTLEKFVNENRKGLIRKTEDVLGLGAAKQVNNLDSYYAEYLKVEKPGKGKVKLPGHVRAAVNYNELAQEFEPGSKLLRAGDKVIVFYIKKNYRGLKSLGFPSDIMHLPQWFIDEFQVDMALTEEKMIDSKLEGIFEALDWEVPTPQRALLNSIFEM